MARLSPAKRRLARTKRQNSQLHRERRQLLTEMSPIMRRANVEGQLLRQILSSCGNGYVLPPGSLSEALKGDIDVMKVEDGSIVVEYRPTPVEASKVTEGLDASKAFKPSPDDLPLDPAMIGYVDAIKVDGPFAEPEAAV